MHLAAAAGLAPHAAHGQDAARLAADHARQGQLAQVERAAQVHVQHVLPLLRGDIGEQLLLGNARVAHQHIHMAHGLLHGVERHLTAGAGGHVALDRQQARQRLFQRRRRLGVGVVEHRHPVARLPEGAGRRGSDAQVAARDQHAAPVGRRDCRFRYRLHRRFRFCGRFRRSFLHRLLFRRRGPGCLVRIAQVKGQFKFIIVQESALLPFVLCLQKIPQAGRSRPPPHPWAALCSSFRSRPVLRRARWSVRVVSTSYH